MTDRCGVLGPHGEACRWGAGHPPYLYQPGVARDGNAHEIAHSWAEPPLLPAAVRTGMILAIPAALPDPE